jgi:hypothetical protein
LGAAQIVVNGLVSVVAYALLAFGIFKIYSISSDVSEIKDLLRDIKRNTEDVSLTPGARVPSTEAQLRAVSAAASQTLPESEPASRSSH